MKDPSKGKIHAHCTVDPSELERDGEKIFCRKCSCELADLDAEEGGSVQTSSKADLSRRLLCGVVSAVALGGCSTVGKVSPDEEVVPLPGIRAYEGEYYGSVGEPRDDDKVYPEAKPIDGQAGMVESPYGGHTVDVSRIPPGSLVIDPNFGVESGKFFRI